MNKIVKYSIPNENLCKVYNDVKQYLFNNEYQHDKTIVEKLRDVKKLSEKYASENNESNIMNPFEKALEDFLENKREAINECRYSLKKNIYIKSAYAGDDWIWASENWCEIQIENYTDCNGLCNISFILSTPNYEEKVKYNIYVNNILYIQNAEADVLITVNVSLGRFESKILKIEKTKSSFYYVQNDDRKLFFCIKKFETIFDSKDDVDIIFDKTFSQNKWNNEWNWSVSCNGYMRIVNYTNNYSICNIKILLGVINKNFNPIFNIYLDRCLIYENAKCDELIEIKTSLGKMQEKLLHIVKLDEHYDTVENDNRNLYFCIKRLTINYE